MNNARKQWVWRKFQRSSNAQQVYARDIAIAAVFAENDSDVAWFSGQIGGGANAQSATMAYRSLVLLPILKHALRAHPLAKKIQLPNDLTAAGCTR